MKEIKFINARVIDPIQNKNNVLETIFINSEGKIENMSSSDGYDVIDCRNSVMMAGGIDLHTHIGGGKTNIARMLMPEGLCKSNGFEYGNKGESAPGTIDTGYRYAEMGYTAAFEPAMIFSNARHAHLEMGDVPILDHGAYVMLGNDEIFLEMLAKKKGHSLIRDYVGWSINASKAMGVKVVNPGGISAFKFNQRSLDLDEKHSHWGLTPRNIVHELALSLQDLGVPHPLHIHASNLGVPGNIKSTIETIDALEGIRGHLTHVQFHCYGSEGPKKFSSASLQLAEKLKSSKNISIDVGQIIFGQTVTTSGDTMKQHSNRNNANPKKWVMGDIECTAGCGVVPFKYKENSFVNALQWVIGLEIFLLVDDPWQVVLTTDHPNGGPFTSYPHLIKLLMNKEFRDEQLNQLHPDVIEHCILKDIKKELSLYEIAIMTRAAPAKILGLVDNGSLAKGMHADIVVYKEDADQEYMFSTPEYVFKNGKLVVRNGKLVGCSKPGLHYLNISFDGGVENYLKKYYEKNCVGQFRNGVIAESEIDLFLDGGEKISRKI